MAQQHTATLINGIDVEIVQNTVAAVEHDPSLGSCKFRATNIWIGGAHNRSRIDDYFAAGEERHHHQAFDLDADEPPLLAGEDHAPNPVERLLHALASCLMTSIVAHAAVRGIHIEEIESELEGDIDLRGFLGLSNDMPRGYTNIRVKFRVKGDAEDLDEIEKLVNFSPVYNALIHGAKVDVEVEPM